VRSRDGRVRGIVEETDASEEERAIGEVATSIYCFRRSLLAPALRRLSPENAKGEYYLTDVVGVLHTAGHKVLAISAEDASEALGVNDRAQLANAEAVLRRRINHRWMGHGVTMVDPERTYIDWAVRLEPDVTLLPGVVLQGRSFVGSGSTIGPEVRLHECVVGRNARVEYSVGFDAEIGAGASVGPFAVLTPGDHVPDGFRTGAFYNQNQG
jgi:bifunctional UDP-N-acetylglucosamine pyrophosphorylase/glucosamine-1-phosphate N-acetyltransferase